MEFHNDWLDEMMNQTLDDLSLGITNLSNRIKHASELLDKAVIENNYRAIIDIHTYRKIKELLR